MSLTINELIFSELTPPLNSANPNDLGVVEKRKKEAFYALQLALEKSDLEVEIEANYSNQEKMLVAYYATWLHLSSVYKAYTSSTATIQKEKRVKADVVEIEYADGATFSTKESLQNSLKKLCSKAIELGLSLPICIDCFPIDANMMKDFTVTNNSFAFFTPAVV